MNRRHRIGALAAAALLAPFALVACGDNSAEADPAVTKDAPLHDMLPAELQDKDSLTIASNVEYPPFEFLDSDNKTVLGIDREIADGLEKQLGIKLVFDNIAFDAIIPGLESGRYEMAMSAMTDNLERQQQVDFVDYFKAGAGVMSRTEDGDSYQTLEDICGLTAGIVKGTTEVPQAAEGSKACNRRVEVRPFLENMRASGEYEAALAKYGLESGAVDAFPINGATE